MINIQQCKLTVALTITLLTGCSDEQLDRIRNNIDNDLYPDKDFSSLVQFPLVANPDCPNWQPDTTITLDKSLTLPLNCAFQRVTLLIQRPNIELNCNNAAFNGMRVIERKRYGEAYPVDDAPTRYGIVIQGGETDQNPVADVTIRNCQFLNYVDSMTVQMGLSKTTLLGLRDGSIAEADIQAKAPTRINVIGSRLINSHFHGIFLNRYISHLTVKNSQIMGSGNSAIYLGADTEHALITQSQFEGNGFFSYDTDNLTRTPRRTETSRREGIALDASSYNEISDNSFRDNGDGGIYLYKNCWEYVEEPYSSPHRYGSNHNLISHNTFHFEENAVWVAERTDRDLASFTCGDPVIFQQYSDRFYRDIAQYNVISNNTFQNNKIGIRIQDDGNTVSNNTFINTTTGTDIWINSWIREKIGDPVKNTTVVDNALSKPTGVLYENQAN